MTKLTCQYCGYKTLPETPTEMCEPCPVCGYLHASIWKLYGTEPLDLICGQESFLNNGPPEGCREPRDDEPRDPDWMPLRKQYAKDKASVREIIERAFPHVRLGNGTSLADAYAIDLYQDTAPKSTRHRDWHDVTIKELDEFRDAVHLDEQGLRFYLPAFMTHTLRVCPDACDIAEQLMFLLGERSVDQFSKLDAPQVDCVREFLGFMNLYHPSEYNIELRKAMPKW